MRAEYDFYSVAVADSEVTVHTFENLGADQ